MSRDREYILKLAAENRVKFIRLWFSDILGFLKSFAITIDELEDALVQGVRFDGSTLQGAIRRDESEMIALPDTSTFQVLPWRPREDSVARMFCDIYRNDMTPYEGDSRYVLKRMLRRASDEGYSFYTGPEIEFFFFKNSSSPEILDRGGYYDLTPLDMASDYRRQTVLTLEKMGIGVISSHHEGAHSQHEIDLRHENALTMADNIMTFRLIVKEIGQSNGIYASFMPKPLAEQNGSGMHIHQSLFLDEENIFFDYTDESRLSVEGRRYIAGLLRHSREFFAITNQWINSYKRLLYGFEAPTHISWSTRCDTSLIRVPECNPDKPGAMRVELRNPDPACNPYLVFAAVLASGLKGISERYELPPPLDPDRKLASRADFQKMGLEPLPTNLGEALVDLGKSALMRDALGDRLVDNFIENKMFEIDRFNSHITDYEISEYLPIL
ncbi:MAG: putative glutamine synthetase 2 [Spirochaetes bacterium ADurb.BinA120]|nr:MAG: putative glutamine synthetase 2 [Spirochaetes bacterium ADurb.BinA120]